MPNWCMNTLKVTGTKADLAKFAAAAKPKARGLATANNKGENVLSFHNFLPYPSHFIKQDKKAFSLREKIKRGKLPESTRVRDGYNSGGYEWCVNNWGTKWDAAYATVMSNRKKLVYSFDTAWSPPTPVVLAMSKQFPSLKFRLSYDEPGIRFTGKYEVQGGKVIIGEWRDY